MSLLRRLRIWRQARLSRQIILPVVAATIVFLAALGFVAIWLGQNAIERQVETRNLTLARVVANDATRFFQVMLDTTRLQEPELLDTDNPERQADALVALRRVFPQTYTTLSLVDAEGATYLELTESNQPGETFAVNNYDPPRPLSLDPSTQDSLQNNRLSVSDAVFRPITNWPYITATLPLATDTITSSGALIAEIDLRSFWAEVDSISIEEGNVIILDRQGIILAHPNRQLVGQVFDTAAIEPVFSGFEDTVIYERDSETFLAAYSPIGGAINWGVVVEQNRDIALIPVRTLTVITVIVMVLSALGVAGLLRGIIRRAVQPVEQLSRITQEIGSRGELKESLADEAVDTFTMRNATAEIGTLATSFNQMLGSLQEAQERLRQLNEQLEQRVAERTIELESVLEVARLSGASLRSQDVLATILEQVSHLISYDTATIMLLNEETDTLEIVAAAGEHSLREYDVVVFDVELFPLNLEVLQRHEPVIVNDTANEPLWHDAGGLGRGAWLAAPLITQDRPIGVIGLFKTEVHFYTREQAALLTALASQVAVMVEHARLYEESTQRVERELREAEQIQRHLFPAAPAIEGLSTAALYRPARETTGDFYEFIVYETPHSGKRNGYPTTTTVPLVPLAPRQIAVILGDVSGKSLPAALLMAMARTALRSAASTTPEDPAAVLVAANKTLLGEVPRGSFVATSYALFDRRALTLQLVNAAQPAPLLLRNGRVTLLEGIGNHLPLGVMPVSDYAAAQVAIQPGDVVVFYTDGVLEATSRNGELLGFERLSETLVQAGEKDYVLPHQIIDYILHVADEWMRDTPQSDDIALVVLKVN